MDNKVVPQVSAATTVADEFELSSMSTEKIRAEVGLSGTAAAALAEVSPHTWRIYELNAMAIRNAKKRAACEAGRAKLIARAVEVRRQARTGKAAFAAEKPMTLDEVFKLPREDRRVS